MNLLETIFGKPAPSINPTEAQTRLKGVQPPIVIDVREPDEYQAGHIAGAKLIPLGQLARKMFELPKDRDIVCVCASGSRSNVATQQLLRAGYPAINLLGGMGGWQMAQLPIKKGGAK